MKRINGEGSIYRARSGKWVACISIGRNEKGKLIRRQRATATKKEAVEALAELKATYNGDIALSLKKEAPLADWLGLWLKTYRKGRIREHTMRNYKYIIQRLQHSAIADIPLYKLQSYQIQQVIDGYKGKALGQMTLTILRAALAQAVNEGIIPYNAARAVKPPKHEKREVKTIDINGLKRLIDGAQNPLRIAILIAWGTGARPEEVLALQWDDIDLDARKMSITKAVNHTSSGIVIVPPKTANSRRTISLPSALVADLKRYKREQAAYILANRDTYNNNGYIIADSKGSPLYTAQYYYRFRRQARRQGVDITPKGLRHSHATQLFGAGWAPKAIQHRLGHAKISITLDIYTHLLDNHDADIADYINTIYPVADTLPSK